MDEIARIKALEKEISQEIEKARQTGEKSLETAKAQRPKKMEHAISQAKKKAEKIHEKSVNDAEAKVLKIKQEADKDLIQLEKAFKEKQDAAVDVVLDDLGA